MKALLSETIEDFGFPVTLAFSKIGEVFLSERVTGRLWQIDGKNFRLIKTFPVVPLVGHNETGLLGIALDPNFEKNKYVYCYYTAGSNEKNFKNRIVKINLKGDMDLIYDDLPAGLIHNGGIISFGPDGKLYVGIGVQDKIRRKAQNIDWLGGKILRLNKDGSVPKDNPFSDSPIYSYGHRNIFGLAFHPKTGHLYACDVGPDHDDEINLIKVGSNYGWPEVMGASQIEKYTNPLISYTPTITPTQCVFVGNDLYFGSFNEGTVHQLTLEGKNFDKVKKDKIVFKGKPWGIVGVFYGPDKNFYITTPSQIQKIDI